MSYKRAIGLGSALIKSGALATLVSRTSAPASATTSASASPGSPLVKIAVIGALGIGGFLVYRHLKKKNATP